MNGRPERKIRTRETKRDVRVLDRSRELARRLAVPAARTAEPAYGRGEEEVRTPAEYAEDRMRTSAEYTADRAGRLVKNALEKRKEKKRDRRPGKRPGTAKIRGDAFRSGPAGNAARTGPAPERGIPARPGIRSVKIPKRSAPGRTPGLPKGTVRTRPVSPGRALPKTAKGSIKTVGRTVKTAERTSRMTVKTAKTAAGAAKTAARAGAGIARTSGALLRKAAASAHRTAEAAGRAAAAAVRAMAASVKSLGAALVAGGGTALVTVVLVSFVGLLAGSVFGIFFAGEDSGSGVTILDAVRKINTDYQERIADIKESYTYDEVEMSGSSAVWREVLSVYAVKTNLDPEHPRQVASLDEERLLLLSDLFWEMNDVRARTRTRRETVILESDDGLGNVVEEETEERRTTLYITVSHRTAAEMAEWYAFTDEQKRRLDELLDERNRAVWASVLYGIRAAGDTEIVSVALSQVGNIGGEPYWSWYGFGSRVSWCACFVSWCADECGYVEDGVIPKFAVCGTGADWFRERGQWLEGSEEPMPGMIVFFDWDDPDGACGPQDGEADHTGIVARVENGVVYTVEGNAGDSCAENRYPVGYYEILGYGAPAY